jgi:hypothetical protein
MKSQAEKSTAVIDSVRKRESFRRPMVDYTCRRGRTVNPMGGRTGLRWEVISFCGRYSVLAKVVRADDVGVPIWRLSLVARRCDDGQGMVI